MSNYEPSRFSLELMSRLRGAIARFDVNQESLAELCQVSQSQFSKIIRGVRPATVDQVAVIAEALDIDLGKLLSEVDDFTVQDELRTSPVVFVEHERKLPEPYMRDFSILDGFGRHSSFEYSADVGSTDEDVESQRQSDMARAAKERSKNRGETH